jgi:hypothetical protein
MPETATPEQLLALLEAPHWKTPGSTSRRPEGPTGRRTEGQAAVNLTVLDHIAEGRDALARAAKLAGEGSTLAEREARAIRAAQAMKSEAIMGMHYRVRQHSCPSCGCFTLLPNKGRAFCVNRHCARGGMQRRWDYRELAFIGPGTPKRIGRTESARPPRDVMDKHRLLEFFAQTGRPFSESTLRRLAKAHHLPTWTNPLDTRAALYSLSDVATVHAVHMADKEQGDCTAAASRPPCTGLGDMFFTSGTDPKLLQTARSLCGECPLRQACLDTAMQYGRHTQFGVAGGLTAKERRTLKSPKHPR